MLTNYVKRMLSFALALVMVLGMLPMQAFATEEDSHAGHDHEVVAESEKVIQLREMADAFVEKYELTPDMPDSVLEEVYTEMDSDLAFEALIEMEDMIFLAEELTEEEIALLEEEVTSQLIARFYNVVDQSYTVSTYNLNKPIIENVTVTTSVNSGAIESESILDGVLTLKVKGHDDEGGCADENKNGKVTVNLTNNYKNEITLLFNWQKDAGTITGVTDTGASSGSERKVIGAGKALTITLETPATGAKSTAELTLSGVEAWGAITFGAAENGSYTVDGEAPADKFDSCGTTTYTLTAIPAEGYVLKGWYENGNAIVEGPANTTITYTNLGNATVVPEFIDANMTVEFAAPHGNGSYTVNGEAAPVTKTEATGTSYALVATPASERNAFVAWYMNGEKYSENATITLTTGKEILENSTIYAEFRDLTGYNITVDSDASKGSVSTAGVWDGLCYQDTQVTLTASPASGHAFLAWTDAEGKIVSNANPYSFVPAADVSLKAVFSNPSTEAWFKVDNVLYNDLNAATAAGTKVVLAADGTLPAGDYTIPGGVTLLIPMNTSESVQTTQPTKVDNTSASYTAPTAYRTLHMASGANITVAGAISVAGSQYAGGTGSVMGGVHGPVGFIKMAEGSKITVNGGAYLYAWGYVIGSGSVEVLSGGTVYESFQTTDWRGGSATSSIATGSKEKYKGVFPMNQYYVQNIEVPMKLNAGAEEKGYSCTTITLAGVQGAEVPFVGENSLFTIVSGYLIKDYDEATDRQVYTIYGDVSMEKIVISMKLSALGGSVKLDSSMYVLPITCNLTVDVVSGTIDITQDLCFLPGSEIIIRQGAYCNLADGKSIYVYDLDQWGGYVGPVNNTFIALWYAPGRTGTRTALSDAKIQIDGTVNADAGFLYTTAGGAVVTSTGTGKVNMKLGTATETYQFTQVDTSVTPVAIPVEVAKLQNADGTTTDPGTEINPTYGTTYTYTNGVWVPKCNTFTDSESGETKSGCVSTVAAEEVTCLNPDVCKYCGSVLNPGEHTPDREAPTCTDPVKCTVEGCGVVITAALGHSEETVPGKAATCYATGLSDGKKCNREGCGITLVEQTETPMVAHTWSSGTQTKAPTCTETGTKEYFCTVCSGAGITETKTETVDALGHSMTETPYQAATCTAAGTEGYFTCGTCNKYFVDEDGDTATTVAERVIAQKPHEYETTVTKDPTCTEKGSQTTACKYGCGVGTVIEEIQQLDHNIVQDAAVPATCTETGLTAGQHCTTCDTQTVVQEIIPALNHKWIDKTYKWVQNGEDWYCEASATCDNDESHTMSEKVKGTLASETPATCTSVGKRVYNASFTNAEFMAPAKEVTLTALGHEYGEVSYSWSTVAGKEYCAASRSCTRCNASTQSESVEATAETTEATCSAAGMTVYTASFTTNSAFTTQTKEVEIPVKDHDWNEATYVWGENNATCTAKRICKANESHVETETVEVKTETTPASCTVDGKIVYIATFENAGFAQQKAESVIESEGHQYEGKITTPATCTGTGIKTFTCSVCGDDYTEDIAVLGHSFTDYVSDENATCTEDGHETAVCDREGCYVRDTKVLEDSKLGHDWKQTEAKKATCLAAGNNEYWSCQREGCGLVVEKDMETPTTVALQTLQKLDHEYDTVVTAPTCLEQGYTTHTCKNGCNEGYTDTYIPALNHKYDDGVITTAPTCVDKGVKTFTCQNDSTHTYTEDVNALGHNYVLDEESSTAAGCTNDGENVYVCDRCEDGTEDHSYTEVVEATGHSWFTGPDAKPATCIEEGWTGTAMCGNCYERTTGEVIPKTDHTWNAGTQTKAPTCTQAEEWTYTCTVKGCGVTTTETMDKAAHKTSFVEAKAATCTEDGYVAHYTCATCDNLFADGNATTVLTQVILPTTGHTTKMTPAKAATCLADGNNAYYTCQNCGKVFKDAQGNTETTVEAENIKSEGHKYDMVVTDPTCTAKGYTTYTCPNCTVGTTDHSFVDDYVDALGHDYTSQVTTQPTCTGTGIRTYTCQNDSKHTYTESVDALGHSFVNYVSNNNATCTEDGTETAQCERCTQKNTRKEEGSALDHDYVAVVTKPDCTEKGYTTYTCSRGDYSYVADYVDPLGHTEETFDAVLPTCTGVGLTEGTYCSVCGETLVEQTIVPATGHTLAEAVKENVIDATCMEAGSYQEVVYCSVSTCRAEISRDTKLIDATGHTEVTDAAVDPTCTTTGKTEGKHCSVCGETLKKQETVPALGHTEVVDATKAATCTETGLTEGKHCSVCGETLVAQVVIAAKGHTNATDPAKAPICTETGLTEGKHCSVCGEILVAQEVIDALGHTEVVDAYKAPTCTTTGLGEGKHCSACGEILVAQEVLKALGHWEVTDAAKAATCTETGLTEGKHCKICGETLAKQETVPAKGHTETIDPAKTPTCTATGLTEGRLCSVCNEVLVAQEVVPAKGHTEELIPVKAPTCTATGLTEGTKCSVCAEFLVAQEEILALGHKWDDGRVTTLPTCDVEGVRTFTCDTCNGTRIEAEPTLGHDVVMHEAKQPTYTSPGWEAYETCNRCDEYNTMVSIPALGEAEITSFDEFIENLAVLEEITDTYVKKVSPGKDPMMLIIKYIRTGVDRYNSGSWNIMAGYEDADFAKYVSKYEEEYNLSLSEGAEMMKVTGLKNIHEFDLPNGDLADIGHVFGSMDITYTNKTSEDHADVSGWAGDTVDLMSMVDQFGWESTDLEGMVEEIGKKYFLKYREDFEEEPIEGTFSNTDIEGDLDAFYVMQTLYATEYENGTLTDVFSSYMTPQLTSKARAKFFLENRLDGASLRSDVRDAVFNEYVANGVVATLEGTRPFNVADLTDLRKACCYVVADYLCRLAGDFVENDENPHFTVFQSTSSVLAPGITQKINYATTADGKTMVYYLATGDVTRGDVHVFANYNNNDPAAGWEMSRVIDQANVAQQKYGDPESQYYIPNYNVIASINGAGYDMSNGEPSGVLVMNGVVYHPVAESGFFGILDDGTAMIGSMAEYNALQAERPGRVREAIATFGDLIRDGKIVATNGGDRASRTAVGITATGKVVFMVLDGRQGDLSCGGDMMEIAQIMLDAGCVIAVNLDGGGSSTYVAREEGATELSVVSKPSDGISRSVSTSLLMVSTAPSSTAFDHAVIDSDYSYFTIGSSGKFEATAVSATGNVVDMPEGVQWAVSNNTIGTITQDGVFTAAANGTMEVQLKLDGQIIGSKKIHVVIPDNVYFEKEAINAIYGQETVLPVRAVYEGKNVAINEGDVTLSLSNETAGAINGFIFLGDESCGLKKVKVNAALVADPEITASMELALYTKDEASFDFENATGGDRQLAWDREVSNANEEGNNIYRAEDMEQDMVTTYSFAIDMSQIAIPKQLEDLTYMLPGADMADASAWNFLLQLAERVSVLTEVRPVLYFDKNLVPDWSEMTIANEYFYLKETIYNKEENSLTLVLKWHRQEKPIDPATANPLCILTGIKLTPREDAAWNSNSALPLVNRGTIAYDIYLRANALYSFSNKPENQEIYGLYPFQNVRDDGVQENGGHFSSIYKEFEDNYTLINGEKDGWVVEGGGFAYYENGEKHTGICLIDGYYYDFGENGINIGQKKYSGYMTDEQDNVYYLKDGIKQTGWYVWDMKHVEYFNPETGIREELTKDEIPSTCIIDGQCLYTTASGQSKLVKYDDAAGHEYVKQPNGAYVCSTCGWERIEMPDVNVTLTNKIYTYNGAARTPATTATAHDGRVLTKPGQTDYPDYYSTYTNNVDVGTAAVTLTARKYGVFVNKTEWRGNAAESITVTYEIRPDLPKNAMITGSGDDLMITWTAAMAPGVTYVIYGSADGKTWTEIGRTTALSYAITEAQSAMVLQIETVKEVGGKNYVSVNRADVANSTLQVVTGNNDAGKPTLKWNAVPGAEKYEVYRSKTQNGGFVNVFTTTGKSYTHSSAVEDTTYYYYVKAIFGDGSVQTSDVVSNSGLSVEILFEVTGVNNDKGKPNLKWTAVEGAEKYEVYRCDTIDGVFNKMFTTTGKSYTNTSAVAGNTYYYRVVAYLANGKTEVSEVVSVTCQDVFKITTGNNDKGKPTLKWTAVTGVDHYEVYRSETANGEFVKTFTTKGTSYTNTSAKAGNTYYYKVKTVLTDDTEKMSEAIAAACLFMDVELNITTGNNDKGKPTLKWNAIPGAFAYTVYRCETIDGEYVETFTTKGTSYTNTSAKAGNTYYYKVVVHMANGDTKTSEPVENVCLYPGAVFVVTIGNNAAGKPTLKWNAIPGAERYEVYRSDSADGQFVKTFSTTGRSYTNTAAVPTNTYYYKVKVYLADGTEKFSPVVSGVCLVPGVNFVITTGHNDAGKPTLKWEPIAGAERYEVYRSDSADGKFVMTFSTKGTSYTNTAAKAGNTYYYMVKVYLVDGTDETSKAVFNDCVTMVD